jgi:hypothetical protein
MRHDPREQLLAQLNAAREARMDCDPADRTRHGALTDTIDELLERLTAMAKQ